MKKALVSPGEYILDQNGEVLGSRIAEVRDEVFEVAEPLFWVDCGNPVTPESYYWNGTEAILKPVPVVVEEVPPSQADMGGMTVVA